MIDAMWNYLPLIYFGFSLLIFFASGTYHSLEEARDNELSPVVSSGLLALAVVIILVFGPIFVTVNFLSYFFTGKSFTQPEK